MKAGGAEVSIIEGFAVPDEETPAATLSHSARDICNEGPIGAFIQVAFMADGRVMFNWRHTSDCPIARTLMPEYIAELVRRYCLMRHEAQETFDDMFQWVE